MLATPPVTGTEHADPIRNKPATASRNKAYATCPRAKAPRLSLQSSGSAKHVDASVAGATAAGRMPTPFVSAACCAHIHACATTKLQLALFRNLHLLLLPHAVYVSPG